MSLPNRNGNRNREEEDGNGISLDDDTHPLEISPLEEEEGRGGEASVEKNHSHKTNKWWWWCSYRKCLIISGALIMFLFSLGLSIAIANTALLAETFDSDAFDVGTTTFGTLDPRKIRTVLAEKIAFGSCISYDVVADQPIWKDVIKQDINAWIWSGDAAYLDNPFTNCSANPSYIECNCTVDYWTSPPFQCYAGNVEHIKKRAILARNHKDYNDFVRYMCDNKTEVLTHCNRPIMGVWDDHDFGANNANSRLPNKDLIRQQYLDFIGEHQSSPRRMKIGGIYHKYRIGSKGKQYMDVFLLDMRTHRMELPCSTRRSYCNSILSLDIPEENIALQKAWVDCQDFLVDNIDQASTPTTQGSCCTIDEKVTQWCTDNPVTVNPYLHTRVCNTSHEEFARNLPNNWREVLDLPADAAAPFCDVLGLQQREWLRLGLELSKAPLKLIVSPSVLFHNPLKRSCPAPFENLVDCPCSGDDLDCYLVAQRHLIHLISMHNKPKRCAAVIVGDYHYHDIKYLKPGNQYYPSARPLFQVLSSGLTQSTAKPLDCTGYAADPLKLRDHPECGFVTGPGFGLIDFAWNKFSVAFQIHSLGKGKVLESILDLNTCEKASK